MSLTKDQMPLAGKKTEEFGKMAKNIFGARGGIGSNIISTKEVVKMKYSSYSSKKIAALVAAIALVVVGSTNAFALRQLTEAERAQVIAEYLAAKEAAQEAKAPESAPAVKWEAAPAPAAVVKVEVVQAEAKNDAPVVKVEQPAEAKVEAEKAEIKAEAAAPAASADVTVEITQKPNPLVAEEALWGTGPRPAMVDCAIRLEDGVPTVDIPGTIEVKGETTSVNVGDDVGMVFPDRGATVSVKQMAAQGVLVPEWKNGKVAIKRLPTFTSWPKDKAYDFASYTCLRDFLMMRPYGLIVTAVGVGNIEEAVRGRPLDNPVRTISVLESPELDAQGRIHGVRKLYAVSRDGKTVPVSVQNYSDYSGVVYWIQMRVPAAVLGTNKRQIHWRSAKYRAQGIVANDGTTAEPQAFLTLFFGAQEGSERRVGGKIVGAEGKEATIPTHPLVSLSRADAEAALEAYKASLK